MLSTYAVLGEIGGLLVLLAVGAALTLALLTGLLVRAVRTPPRHTAGWAIARGLACDPDDMQLEHASWTLDRPDGARIPVWEVAGCGDAGDPTAVLVHGWGHSRIDLLARIEPWQRLCRRVVLYDLRGHGDATGGRTRLGHGEERDLLALLERLDPAPTVLVGHSMGAAIAIRAAASGDPNAAGVVGVVAVAPYDDFHRSLRGRLSRSGFPTRPMSDVAMAWFRLCGIRHAPIDRAAAQLPCPLLVLHGTADSVAPPEHGERIARAAPAGRYHAVAGAGHLDEHVVDAEGVTAQLSRFLREIRPERVSA